MVRDQSLLYEAFLAEHCQETIQESGNKCDTTVLANLTTLMKIANHPRLLVKSKKLRPKVDKLVKKFAGEAINPDASCKVQFLHHLLTSLKKSGDGERVVVISNWTQTLDVVQRMCKQNNWPVCICWMAAYRYGNATP